MTPPDCPPPGTQLSLSPDAAIERALGRPAPYFHVDGTVLLIHRWAHKHPEFLNKWVITPQWPHDPEQCTTREWTLPFAWSGWLSDQELNLAAFATLDEALQALQQAFDQHPPAFDQEGFLITPENAETA